MLKSHWKKNTLFYRSTLVILVVFILIVGRGVWNIYTKEQETRVRLAQVQEEYEELDERSEFLEYEIERLSTDTGIESEIREQYGFAKEGERIFVIIEPELEQATTTEQGFWNGILFWRD